MIDRKGLAGGGEERWGDMITSRIGSYPVLHTKVRAYIPRCLLSQVPRYTTSLEEVGPPPTVIRKWQSPREPKAYNGGVLRMYAMIPTRTSGS